MGLFVFEVELELELELSLGCRASFFLELQESLHCAALDTRALWASLGREASRSFGLAFCLMVYPNSNQTVRSSSQDVIKSNLKTKSGLLQVAFDSVAGELDKSLSNQVESTTSTRMLKHGCRTREVAGVKMICPAQIVVLQSSSDGFRFALKGRQASFRLVFWTLRLASLLLHRRIRTMNCCDDSTRFGS